MGHTPSWLAAQGACCFQRALGYQVSGITSPCEASSEDPVYDEYLTRMAVGYLNRTCIGGDPSM